MTFDEIDAVTVWAGLVLLLLACAGNAEWWVILVNRRHALRYRHSHLIKIRHLHDAALLLFPPFILWAAGLTKNGLLRGGSVHDLALPVQGILWIAWAGVVPLAWSAMRYQLRRPPAALRNIQSTVFDTLAAAETEQARQQIKGDLDSVFLKFPANEVFHLEVNRKHLRVPGVGQHTAPADTLRIAHFSDVHLLGTPGPGYLEFVTDRLAEMQPDAFFFTGDLLDNDDLLPLAETAFARLQAVAPGFFVLGNHDWHLDHETIRQRLEQTGWMSLAERSHSFCVRQWQVLLAGTEAPWIGQNPSVPAPASEHLRILLSHAPDQRNFAAENNFQIVTCGHNHGGQVVLPVVGPVYSPSLYGVKYSGGLFSYRDLLIHVSRGAGARDLLRWRCPPEVSLLEMELEQSPE